MNRQPSSRFETISIIVPVFNGGENFLTCLDALRHTQPPPQEILVVDDGSTDGSAQHAREMGARVFCTAAPASGPAVARNLGAQHARGTILFFVDADVAAAPDVCAKLLEAFAAPNVAAVFGSYDDAPAAPNFAAQYKNLAHHYTHQTARVESHSFWAGCGALRAEIFSSIGGFKTSFTRPCIEDIELGYRLTRAGYHIQLRRDLQVKHLKAWTLRTMIYSDIFDRALPWTRLIKAEHEIPRDLNLQSSNRISAALCWLLLGTFFFALFQSWAWLAAFGLVVALLLLNCGLYRFLWRKRGFYFTLRALPLHWLYYLYSSAAFAYVWFLEPA